MTAQHFRDRLHSKRRLAAGLLAGLCMSSAAWAGVPPPTLSFQPVAPRANQTISLTYTLAACGDVFPGYAPSNRTVEVVGQVVRVTVDHDSDSCIPGQQFDPSYAWTIGPLPAGNYQVELIADGGDAPSTFVLATGDLVVAPGAVVAPSPNTVPSLNAWGLGLMVGLTLAGAGLVLGRRS